MSRKLRKATSREVRHLEEATLLLRAAAGLLARADCRALAAATRSLVKRADVRGGTLTERAAPGLIIRMISTWPRRDLAGA